MESPGQKEQPDVRLQKNGQAEVILNRVIHKNSVKSIMAENNIMQQLSHPLVISLEYAFQDRDNLYVFMKHYEGGDLRFHMMNSPMFSEEQAKFIIACLVSALGYIHKKNIIHRDVKPENLIFDDKGFVHLTDFGVAKYWRSQNFENTSGTPGYMAPEVLSQQNHSYSVDFFALGVIVCELITGRRPYYGRSRQEIKEQVMSRQAVVKESIVVGKWSAEAIDFCNQLIQRRPDKRLGHNGISAIKKHPWLRGFDWAALQDKQLNPPYDPMPLMRSLSQPWGSALKEDDFQPSSQDLQMLRKKEIQDLFFGYEFDSSRKISFDKPEETAKCGDRVGEAKITNF